MKVLISLVWMTFSTFLKLFTSGSVKECSPDALRRRFRSKQMTVRIIAKAKFFVFLYRKHTGPTVYRVQCSDSLKLFRLPPSTSRRPYRYFWLPSMLSMTFLFFPQVPTVRNFGNNRFRMRSERVQSTSNFPAKIWIPSKFENMIVMV